MATARVGPRRQIHDLARLLRVRDYVKNGAVVVAPLLSGRLLEPGVAPAIVAVFLQFCLASSVVYVLNDYLDRRRDRLHPVKRERPIASGRVPPAAALILAGAVLVALVASLRLTGPGALAALATYLVMSIAYSLFLKRIPLLEFVTVAAGYVLRILAGGAATGNRPSSWLLVTVFAGCLMLILAKRRSELVAVSAETAREHRPVLAEYSPRLLDSYLLVSGAIAAVAYFGYLQQASTMRLFGSYAGITTVPCVLIGLFRYLQLVQLHGAGGEPAKTLTRDRAVLVAFASWAAIMGANIAGHRLGLS